MTPEEAARVMQQIEDEFTIVESFTMGSTVESDVLIVTDPYISNIHAKFSRDKGGRTYVEDMGSTNGTWVNEVRIYGRTLIRPGNVVRIGRTPLKWEK